MNVTATMLISDVLAAHPDSARVFMRHGLGCPSCLAAGMETIEAVALMHEVAVESLIDEINALPDHDSSNEE